jgi:hypothetical protein
VTQAKRTSSTAAPLDLSRAAGDCCLSPDPTLDGFRFTVLARAETFGDLLARLTQRAFNSFVADPTTYACVPQEYLAVNFRERLQKDLESRANAPGYAESI